MYKLAPIAPIVGGIAALRLSMDDWLRLGVELVLGVLAIFLVALRPQ